MTAVYAVLGWPVSHSRSPAMHNAALRSLGLDAVYVPLAVPPQRLAAAVEAVRRLGLDGCNVTLPHKSAIMPHLDAIEPAARAIAAVNTVTREGDRLIGSNTDAEGLTRALREAGVALEGARVIVLGAGGAARAAVVGLAQAGAQRITIAARRPAAAATLAGELRAFAGDVTLEARALAELEPACARCDLLVQATSATLGTTPEAERFAATLPLAALPPGSSVCDLVYKPLETCVLARARALGLRPIDGLGMLLHQGALAFERWTGAPAPLATMRTALTGAQAGAGV